MSSDVTSKLLYLTVGSIAAGYAFNNWIVGVAAFCLFISIMPDSPK
jgi:hypothetical protein